MHSHLERHLVCLSELQSFRTFFLVFFFFGGGVGNPKQKVYMGGFLKWWYPQIIHFNKVFHYKPSILGYPYFRKPPYVAPEICSTWENQKSGNEASLQQLNAVKQQLEQEVRSLVRRPKGKGDKSRFVTWGRGDTPR